MTSQRAKSNASGRTRHCLLRLAMAGLWLREQYYEWRLGKLESAGVSSFSASIDDWCKWQTKQQEVMDRRKILRRFLTQNTEMRDGAKNL